MTNAKKDTIEDVTVTDPAGVPLADPGQTIWMRSGNGVEHEVAVGSEAHRRLVESEATVIDDPTA